MKFDKKFIKIYVESQNFNQVIEYIEKIKIFYIKKSIKKGKIEKKMVIYQPLKIKGWNTIYTTVR